MQFTIRAIHQKCAAVTPLFLITFLALAIVSCSKDEPEDILSDKADLVSFVMSKADNPSLSADLQGIPPQNVFYMTVRGCRPDQPEASLTVSPGATVRISNMPVTSSADFTATGNGDYYREQAAATTISRLPGACLLWILQGW